MACSEPGHGCCGPGEVRKAKHRKGGAPTPASARPTTPVLSAALPVRAACLNPRSLEMLLVLLLAQPEAHSCKLVVE